jgi:valyl-tRNA synthetase
MPSSRDKTKGDQGIPYESAQKKSVDEKLDAAIFGGRPGAETNLSSESKAESANQVPSFESDKFKPESLFAREGDAKHNISRTSHKLSVVLNMFSLAISTVAIVLTIAVTRDNRSLKSQVSQIQQNLDALKSQGNPILDFQKRLSGLESKESNLESSLDGSQVSTKAFKALKQDVETVKANTKNLSDDEQKLDNLESRLKKLEAN